MKLVEYVLSIKDKFSPTLKQAQAQADVLNNKLGNISKSSQSSGFSLGSLVKGAGLLGAAMAAWDGAKQIVTMGAQMEQTRVQFETFLGSAQKGNEVIANLQKFSLATPFEDAQVLKAGKSLLAFGSSANDLEPILTKIGNISSATGKDFNELTTIYGKAKIAGTLYAEDINQLVEAGIPVMDLFAKELGVGVDQVKKMASEGKLTFGMMDKAFDQLGGKSGKWGDLMEKQSKTLAGRWSSLVGFAQNLGSQLGEMLLPFMGNLVDAGNRLLSFINENKARLAKMFEPLQKAVQPFLAKMQELFAKVEGYGITLESVFNGVATAIEMISPIIEAVLGVFGALYENVMKIVFAVAEFVKRNEWLQKSLMALWTGAVAVFKGIAQAAKSILGGVGDLIAGIFSGNLDQIKSGIGQLKTAFMEGNPIAQAQNLAKGMAEGYEKGFKGVNLFEGKAGEDKKNQLQKLQDTVSPLAKPNGASSLHGGATTPDKTSSIGQITGTKSTNITVTFDKLIEKFTVETTNMQEAPQKIKDMVSEALVTVLNDVNRMATT